jgi:protein gp37
MTGKYWDKGLQLIDGCTEVSPGCDNCWSRQMARFERTRDLVKDGKWTGEVRVNEHFLDRISRTKKPTVFAIWNDMFHKDVHEDFTELTIKKFIDNPHHTGLCLTKRPDNMAIHFNFFGRPPSNIWLGTTVENQEQADKRIPELLKCPGNLWLSIEPMLGPIALDQIIQTVSPGYFGDCLHWHHQPACSKNVHYPTVKAVILGGETGHNARPTNPDWVRKIRDDCVAAGVPFFFKQWGVWMPCRPSTVFNVVTAADKTWNNGLEGEFHFQWKRHDRVLMPWDSKNPVDYNDPEWRNWNYFIRPGQKRAGRILDGRTHDELPWRK